MRPVDFRTARGKLEALSLHNLSDAYSVRPSAIYYGEARDAILDEAVYAVAAEFEDQVGKRLDRKKNAKPHEERRSVWAKWRRAAEREVTDGT